MIRLFTGLPGAGKTAHAVAEALRLIAEGRQVFVSNLNGMSIPGAIPLDDPRQWESLPPNSVLLVDEAQRFWRATRTLDVPPEVQAMETHRHLGIDFILTTQQPTYLLKHLRGLVGEHTHHLRRTKGSAQTWTWNRCCDDTEALSERDIADVGMFVYPKQVFGMYRSTEQDTHKPGIPRKWKFVGAAALLMVGLFIFGPDYMKAKTIETAKLNKSGADDPSAQPPGQGATPGKKRVPLTLEQYIGQLQPRIAAAPWSAPIFDEREVLSQPELYCISSGPGLDGQGKHVEASARCLTEQGTYVRINETDARRISKFGGTYNPYRQPSSNMSPSPVGAGQSPAVMAAPAAALAPEIPAGVEQQATYGGFRGG